MKNFAIGLAAALSLLLAAPSEAGCPSPDINSDHAINIADLACMALAVQAEQIGDRAHAPCVRVYWAELDLNCDRSVDVGDIIVILHYVVYGTPPFVLDVNSDGCPDRCQRHP